MYVICVVHESALRILYVACACASTRTGPCSQPLHIHSDMLDNLEKLIVLGCVMRVLYVRASVRVCVCICV